MRDFAPLRNLAVSYAGLDVTRMMRDLRKRVDAGLLRRTERDIATARTPDSLRAALRLTRNSGGDLRIVSDPPLIVPVDALELAVDPAEFSANIHAGLRQRRRSLQSERRAIPDALRFARRGRKVVGVGSMRPTARSSRRSVATPTIHRSSRLRRLSVRCSRTWRTPAHSTTTASEWSPVSG